MQLEEDNICKMKKNILRTPKPNNELEKKYTAYVRDQMVATSKEFTNVDRYI